mmetsp:Transcript_139179/g.444743  ORF Transcript_139179/g.444743 Transcript_139179/m.444743 type:complete len:225 (+) Transcript_139179:994-1668(+)
MPRVGGRPPGRRLGRRSRLRQRAKVRRAMYLAFERHRDVVGPLEQLRHLPPLSGGHRLMPQPLGRAAPRLNLLALLIPELLPEQGRDMPSEVPHGDDHPIGIALEGHDKVKWRLAALSAEQGSNPRAFFQVTQADRATRASGSPGHLHRDCDRASQNPNRPRHFFARGDEGGPLGEFLNGLRHEEVLGGRTEEFVATGRPLLQRKVPGPGDGCSRAGMPHNGFR